MNAWDMLRSAHRLFGDRCGAQSQERGHAEPETSIRWYTGHSDWLNLLTAMEALQLSQYHF